jgi:serine/threonine protein kinase
VADIHGYCANAALVDYADGGNLTSFIVSKNRTKTESLRVAYHVAAAVADAHHVDYRKRATIAHTDIKPDQFLLLDGVYKLNDFNRARLIKWNPKRGKQCGFYFEDNLGVVSHVAFWQILISYC